MKYKMSNDELHELLAKHNIEININCLGCNYSIDPDESICNSCINGNKFIDIYCDEPALRILYQKEIKQINNEWSIEQKQAFLRA